MDDNQDRRTSSSVGKRVTAFFRRLVKTNRDDTDHTCVPHDLYRQLEKGSDGILKEKRAARKGKRINKRPKKAQKKRKSGNDSSTDESEDATKGGTSRDVVEGNPGRPQSSAQGPGRCSCKEPPKDTSVPSEKEMPKSSEKNKEDVFSDLSKGPVKYQDDVSSTSSCGADTTGHNPDEKRDRSKGHGKKVSSHQPSNSGSSYPRRGGQICGVGYGRNDAVSDREADTLQPSRGATNYELSTDEITVNWDGSHDRMIRAKICTVRDPTFIWRESEDGLETKPVGMAKKKKERKKKRDEYGNRVMYRPGTPKPPPVRSPEHDYWDLLPAWPSDNDPLDGLEELLDDVVKMEERYSERRRTRVSSQPGKRSMAKSLADPRQNSVYGKVLDQHKFQTTSQSPQRSCQTPSKPVHSDRQLKAGGLSRQNSMERQRKSERSKHKDGHSQHGVPSRQIYSRHLNVRPGEQGHHSMLQ